MKRIPADMRAEVEERAPHFVAEVRRLAELPHNLTDAHTDAVRLRLVAFRGDFGLLYKCLWYADSIGVLVTFTPKGERKVR